MSDYTQVTLFAPKDALSSGNPLKKIKGAEFDPEFAAIATAIGTKYDSADIASDAEAAALTSDVKLITPDKLAHALQNATIVLGANVQLNGGIAATDVARLSVSNVFSATPQVISNDSATLRLTRPSGGANSKHWLFYLFGDQLRISLANDASPNAEVTPVFSIVRSGTTATSANLGATAVTINGNTAWHAGNSVANSSGTYTPSFSSTTNLDAVSASDPGGAVAWNWLRVGNTVTVSGFLTADATSSSALTHVLVSLPVATTFSRFGHAAGGGFRTAANEVISVFVDTAASTTLVKMQWIPLINTSTLYTVHFTYLVI